MVHFIATDAHNTTSRPPLLGEARKAIATLQGDEVASALTDMNPRAVIEGRPLFWHPEPEPVAAPQRRWFSLRR
jgi:protein-tyrosine phosphatase